MSSDTLRFSVEREEAGQRLDRVVIRRVPGLGRKRAARLFASGAVQIDGRPALKGEPAPAGAELTVELAPPESVAAEPDAPLDVRLEMPGLVVVAKPAGQPSVPLDDAEGGTLAGALLGRYPEMRSVGYRPREPGLLHRLDTQTSGLLVAARSASVFEHLRGELRAGRLAKRYLAVIPGEGLDDLGTIDAPIAPDRANRKRVRVGPDIQDHRGARRARTRYRVLARKSHFALVEVEVSHAYRHQVRAHLAFIGHPIAGDILYGGEPVEALGPRHALHASYVAWAGDAELPAFAVEDALPDDLRRVLGD
jgi:23S rRNA pseudouridine1911/1915/1917 synthase